MKKTRTIKIPEMVITRSAKVKKIAEIFCDIGGEKIDVSLDNHYGSGGHNCTICGRDICRNQSCFTYEDDPDYLNDSIRVCTICYPIRYKKYLLHYYNLLDKHDKEREDFFKMIKKESLGGPTK